MSSRPHRRNADLIDWRMLPLGALCVALGGLVSYSAASSFGLGYVGIDQLPRSVIELASLNPAELNSKPVGKPSAETIKRSVEKAPVKVVKPKAQKVVAKEVLSKNAGQPVDASLTSARDKDGGEVKAPSANESVLGVETEELVLPDTADIVARANQAAGVEPVSAQPVKVQTEKISSRDSDNEYQEIRASLDPNALPILRITAPDSKTAETAADTVKTKQQSSADEPEILSRNITDAVDSGVVSRVLELVKEGEPLDGVDEGGQTMLLKAAWNGDELMFDALIERGANINRSSHDGRTPLFGATASGSLGLVKKLVEMGAAVNVQTKDGKTPLMLSARSSYPEIALYLLEQGADPDIVDSKGRNALLYALWDRNIAVIRSLIQYGSSLDQVDNDGHATVDIARLRRIELPGMNLGEQEESTN